MKTMLVTAGSTATHLDKVRILTNIFHGRTGTSIAKSAAQADWGVKLLTSHPITDPRLAPSGEVEQVRFRTFDDLADLMEQEIRFGGYDAVIHSAAVSDYRPNGLFLTDANGQLAPLKVEGAAAAKIPSTHDRLYIELVPTPKLIDRIRHPWGFTGKLVKFKLQAGMSDEELIEIARRSVIHSKADLIVANCLEWCDQYAYFITADGEAEKVSRSQLPTALLRRLE